MKGTSFVQSNFLREILRFAFVNGGQFKLKLHLTGNNQEKLDVHDIYTMIKTKTKCYSIVFIWTFLCIYYVHVTVDFELLHVPLVGTVTVTSRYHII
jgi:hypothetical protein